MKDDEKGDEKGVLLTEQEQANKREQEESKQEGEYREGHGETGGASSVTALGVTRQQVLKCKD